MVAWCGTRWKAEEYLRDLHNPEMDEIFMNARRLKELQTELSTDDMVSAFHTSEHSHRRESVCGVSNCVFTVH